jgi:membrane glycosyltransferase
MIDPMTKDEFKKQVAVSLAGFGMAALMLVLYLTVMTWLAGVVHQMQFSIDRFGQ